MNYKLEQLTTMWYIKRGVWAMVCAVISIYSFWVSYLFLKGL